MKLTHIFRYPVKGLPPEALSSVRLEPGCGIPSDRRFAIAHGRSEFDLANPRWISRGNFLVVAHSPRLACLRTRFADEARILLLDQGALGTLTIDLGSPDGRASLATALSSHAGGSQGGPYTVVEVPGVNLTDSPTQTVSLFNERSLMELEEHIGRPVDRRRFRGNLWIDGLEPWEELEWLGKAVHIGEVTLHVTERIERCAATNANPDSGERDMKVPQALQQAYGHLDFGVLAEVRVGGTVTIDDGVRVPQAA